MSSVHAIILAGGVGSRSRSSIPKQLLEINGKSIIEHTIEKFNKNRNIDEIILVINEEFHNMLSIEKLYSRYSKVTNIVIGGKTRRESTAKGLNKITNDNSKVLIHDAVRPFVSDRTINNCIECLDQYDAVYPAVSSADTIVERNADGFVENIPVRKNMLRGQTPQGFRTSLIKEAHQRALFDKNVDEVVTNDCGLVNRYNLAKIKVVEGNRENIKITYPEDILYLEQLFNIEKKTRLEKTIG